MSMSIIEVNEQMDNWEKSKQEFIDKLGKADAAFDEIFRTDQEELVIQGSEREELRKMQEENRTILRKLKSREFTVSIVGLEKAGKSTLGNALIKSMVLPEYAQRCTYTTTEIRSGDADVAEVYFYSREEFNKKFRQMLDEVKFPEGANFDGMTMRAFEEYWQAVKNDPEREWIYNQFDATTAADIRDILNGKQIVSSLLGQDSRKFGKEFWGHNKFNEFKTYITGIEGINSEGIAIRKPHPYAVQSVVIRSTELDKDMRHMVLYDVPGFDSPTKLHKEQTRKMLKESDAIILVTNVGSNPDLTDPQLNMLRTAMSARDNYGVSLSEKAFVFGNKIDGANDAVTAKANLNALRNGVVAHHIALGQHVVGGSARAYLEQEGLMEGNAARRVLDEWQMEGGNGLTLLHEKMKNYYENDRFDVLRKRAENTLSKTREVLDGLLDRYSTGNFTNNDLNIEIVQDIQAQLETFTDNIHEITRAHIDQIKTDHPFTVNMKGNIQEIYQLSADYGELIKKAENQQNVTPDGVYPASYVDKDIRSPLSNIFTANIVAAAVKLTMDQQKDLRERLVAEFLQVMGMESASPYRTELAESVNALFDHMLIDGGKQCNFNSLVERFASTIIRTLILRPFADEQRYQTVMENLADLVSLSVYYNMPAGDSPVSQLSLDSIGGDNRKFFATILAHEGKEQDVDASENESFLRKVFEENKEQICKGADLALELIPIGKWAKLIMKAGVNLANIQIDQNIRKRDKIDSKIEDLVYHESWEKLNAEQRMRKLENIIQSYGSSSTEEKNEGIGSYLEELNARAKASQDMKSKEDMLSILDSDIEILRDITERAVINAIDLERAYTSVINKNVELIRTQIKTGDGNKAFRAWCRENAAKLMPSKFETINESKAVNENRKAIVNTIKGVLDKWTA